MTHHLYVLNCIGSFRILYHFGLFIKILNGFDRKMGKRLFSIFFLKNKFYFWHKHAIVFRFVYRNGEKLSLLLLFNENRIMSSFHFNFSFSPFLTENGNGHEIIIYEIRAQCTCIRCRFSVDSNLY